MPMLNMGIANVAPPKRGAHGQSVSLRHGFWRRFWVSLWDQHASQDFASLCDHVGESTKSGIFSNISVFRMRVHHFETWSPVIKGAPLFHSSISNLHLHKQARIQVFFGCSDPPPPPTAVCNIFFIFNPTDVNFPLPFKFHCRIQST